LQLVDGAIVLSATDLNNYLACGHLTALDLSVLRQGLRALSRQSGRPACWQSWAKRMSGAISNCCAGRTCGAPSYRSIALAGISAARLRPNARWPTVPRSSTRRRSSTVRGWVSRFPAPRRRAAGRAGVGRGTRGRGYEACPPDRTVFLAAALLLQRARRTRSRRRAALDVRRPPATGHAIASRWTSSRRTIAARSSDSSPTSTVT